MIFWVTGGGGGETEILTRNLAINFFIVQPFVLLLYHTQKKQDVAVKHNSS
jgi:hypothetical protein